jgi:long-chain acyl-CoA synthetase
VGELKPTVFCSVPRVYNKVIEINSHTLKIYDGVMAKINEAGGMTKYLFDTAYEAKKQYLKDYPQPCTHWMWDYLVFGKIREKLGGRVKTMVTGSAPISAEVMDFLRICFSASVFEGYGQTETAGIGTVTGLGETVAGHVGPPILCNEICLEDVPEMNYYHTDDPPRGEILIRNKYPFKGYFKEPEKTKETVTEDGWVYTGDIGMWLPNGTLKIIDRRKNIFKLSQGEYIAPEKVENIGIQSSFIQSMWVTGNSLENYVVSIVVPAHDQLLKYAKENGKKEDLKELCKDPDINKMILNDIAKIGKDKGLNKLEIPKKIYLEPEMWTVESGLLTPTMKTKRQEMKEKYQEILDQLYK